MARSKTRGLPTVTKNIADMLGEALMTGIVNGVQADIPIGEAEIHRAEPMLKGLDREIARIRRGTRPSYTGLDEQNGHGAGSVGRRVLSPR